MIRDRIEIKEGLFLTHLTKSDFPRLVQCLNDPKIFENTLTIPYPYRRKDAEFYYKLVKGWEEKYGFKREWQIRLGKELIGGIGLMYDNGVESHSSKIGYWIEKEHRRKGIMTMVLKHFVEYVFSERTELKRLEAHVFPPNIGSQKILEKTGFIREGYMRKALQKEGVLYDVIQYAILHPTIS